MAASLPVLSLRLWIAGRAGPALLSAVPKTTRLGWRLIVSELAT